jgi:hypothetical protein
VIVINRSVITIKTFSPLISTFYDKHKLIWIFVSAPKMNKAKADWIGEQKNK